ncbi:transposase [Streptomyces sp. NPDC093252]|uniref:transposase n=1 Tax=Streptomyces sp. NPDC093252 TaxID=3154980 RepID=UPI003418196F
MLSVVNADGSTESGALVDELVREGARRMPAAALEAEVNQYTAELAAGTDGHGRRPVVRDGHHRTRTVVTTSGPVEVTAPRVNDRRADDATGERDRHSSKILAPWCRRSPRISEVLPLLCLHGLSSGDFVPALEQFPGGTAGLSPVTVTRLTEQWSDDRAAFQGRDPSERDCVHVWAEGVHPKVRPGRPHSCVLVLLGVRRDGTEWPKAVPIESAFSTVKPRTGVTRGAGSPAAAPAMAFKPVESARARWRAITGAHPVSPVRAGARFENGVPVERAEVAA